MGTSLFGHCEACCGKDANEVQSDNNPFTLKRNTRNSKGTHKNCMKKILITSSCTNPNSMLNSEMSDRTDFSFSLDNSPIKTHKNTLTCLQNNLISFQLYEKLIKGERLHSILEPLAFYTNNFLYELLLSILLKIKIIFKDSFFAEVPVINLFNNFLQIYQELNNRNILDEIKMNMEEDSRIKYNLLDMIESAVELYHFFKYKILYEKEPYNQNYWEQYKDSIYYMKQKVDEIKNGVTNINLSLGDNKLKIIN